MRDLKWKWGGVLREGLITYVAGVPHLVIPRILSPEKARELRMTYGANVTCFNEETMNYKTYEVGVEAFTGSCGTGAVAITHYLREQGLKLIAPGGEIKVKSISNNYYIKGWVKKI